MNDNIKIKLPDIDFLALNKRGTLFIRKGDVVSWIDECVRELDKYSPNELPPQVREFVKGMADILARSGPR